MGSSSAANQVTVLVFGPAWSAPAQLVRASVDAVLEELAAQGATLRWVEGDDDPLVDQHQVEVFPTVVVIDGERTRRISGAFSGPELVATVRKLTRHP